ncbi:MAG: radical SAM protein [Bacteroidetes bacterium HGW-Bacteroidetes-17]|jgi:histone acetyltransferase (RNA polymerase elongator complex component)|nr:MAG: radical SAM protein [Bacteroidetes bacterium HGW-Bacteroidetes-17]
MTHKNYTIPIFIPELACPFQCLYCDQRKISGKSSIPNEDEVTQIILAHLNTIPKQAHIELGFFGGNFTGIDKTEQEKYLKLVQPYLDSGAIQNIRCSTRPDYINHEVLQLLKKYRVGTIELGAQSMDDEVLKKSKRGHTVADTLNAAKLIREYEINLGLQMMIGLPGDTKQKAILTARKIIEAGADNTRIYPTLVIKNTKLEEMYHQGRYQPLTMEKAVDWTAAVYKIFEQSEVKVLRIGLHPSEGLLDGSDLVAGPFHPSFRELVLTEIWRKKLSDIKSDSDSITITVNPKELNYAVGYYASNKKMLSKKFKSVKFGINNNLANSDYELDYHR